MMETNRNQLREALTTLGAVLADRGLSYELVLVGGGALNLCGLIDRPTRDIDVVARVEGGAYITAVPLPALLLAAANDVAAALDLAPDWLNSGPADLFHMGLPQGFAERTVRETFGGLDVLYASRQDQVAFKLYAAALAVSLFLLLATGFLMAWRVPSMRRAANASAPAQKSWESEGRC